jgi:succinate dehydrogenase flavin-adding protein (antitoxin of CptAB toxin-antitoxin module)
MLELDVALRGFLEAEYAALDPAGREAFVALLRAEDQTLFEWLMGRSAPADPAMRVLVDRLRRFRRPPDPAAPRPR